MIYLKDNRKIHFGIPISFMRMIKQKKNVYNGVLQSLKCDIQVHFQKYIKIHLKCQRVGAFN